MTITSTYIPIANTTLSSTSTAVTFSSIPQTYKNLVVLTSTSMATGGIATLLIQFNGDTNSNYSYTRILGNGSAISSSRSTSLTAAPVGFVGNNSGQDFNPGVINIINYISTSQYKSIPATSGDTTYSIAFGALWQNNTNAITSITFTNDGTGGTFATGSSFTLYGIASA